MTDTYTISQLAEEYDVTPRAMRFYEQKDLLHPERRGQMRVYNARDRVRLGLILRGKRFGFSLTEIKEMLDLYDPQDGQAAQLKVTLARTRARRQVLEQQRQDIDDALNDLDKACEELSRHLKAKGLTEQEIDAIGVDEPVSVSTEETMGTKPPFSAPINNKRPIAAE